MGSGDVCAEEYFSLAENIQHYYVIERDEKGKPVRMGSAVGNFFLERLSRKSNVTSMPRPSEAKAGQPLRSTGESKITKRAENTGKDTPLAVAYDRLKNPEQWDAPASQDVLKMRFAGNNKLAFETVERD